MGSDGAALLNDALKKHFGPVLRSDGFKGSARTYRRVRGELVHVVNIQGSMSGGQFAVNLGAHLAFLPDVLGNDVDPAKLTEMLCEFRGRMRGSGVDQWWKYQNDEKSATRAVAEMVKVWKSHGKGQLEALGAYPADFARLTPADLDSGAFDFGGLTSSGARLALVFARTRAHEGRADESRAFVAYGLSVAGRATGLANALRQVEHAL